MHHDKRYLYVKFAIKQTVLHPINFSASNLPLHQTAKVNSKTYILSKIPMHFFPFFLSK